MSEPKAGNALASARSPYLKSAAHQPVDWMEWSEKAFERAGRENKPVLLDIGAVWCHWCHVIDRESYENSEIAGLINRHFVAIKVDRDERPDIDARYQMAVSALSGQGGWPLTAFLTPEGKTFYGGTYFPPDDRYGRPGMKRVLETIAQNYSTHRDEIHSSADQIAEALVRAEANVAARGDGSRGDASVVNAVVENIVSLYDPQHGGFGSAPKFPHPAAIDLLLDRHLASGDRRPIDVVTSTLEAMGKGGVYDQIGGGFHRYSVDERWCVPHFEKMLYDNAGLLGNYVEAFRLTGSEFFREIALSIMTFVESVLSRPGGGFYSSQDADINLDDDGDYFTWTLAELEAAVGPEEARAAALRYDIGPVGEMQHNPAKNVLFIDQPVEAIAARMGLDRRAAQALLERAREGMLAARARRPTPFVDPTLYSAWNAMMVSALLKAYETLGLEAGRDRALMAIDLFIEHAWHPARGVAHALVESAASDGERLVASNHDLLDDQAMMASALLDAFAVTGDAKYYDRALALGEILVDRFADPVAGGFFDRAHDAADRHGPLTLPRKPMQDSPTPSGNAVAVAALDRLANLADEPKFREAAERAIHQMAGKARDYGLYAGSYALALSAHLREPLEIVVIGPAGDAVREELLRTARAARRVGKQVLAFTPEAVAAGGLPAGLAATLPSLPAAGRALALVCSGRTCQPPVFTAEELAAALGRAKAAS